jgi:hypothetical protein
MACRWEMHYFPCVGLLLLFISSSLIVHVRGGSSAINKETKQTALIDDQTVRSPSCNALINSWMAGQPIVLIAGNGYQLFPYNLGDRSYVVLGYYVIAHAWGMSYVLRCTCCSGDLTLHRGT